jgi:hypothetical protein
VQTIEQVKLFEELHIQYPDNNMFLENLKVSKLKVKNFIHFRTCNYNAKQISESINKSKEHGTLLITP